MARNNIMTWRWGRPWPAPGVGGWPAVPALAAARERRLGYAFDLFLASFVFVLQFGLLLLLPGADAWSWVAAVTFITVACHGLLLVLQVLRTWPPLFSGRSVGLAGVAYWFHLQALQQGGYFEEFDAGSVVYCLLLVQMFTLGFLATWHMLQRHGTWLTRGAAWLAPEPRNQRSFVFTVLFGGFLSVLPILLLSRGNIGEIFAAILKSRAGGAKGWGRGNLGDHRVFILVFGYFGWAAAALAGVYLIRARRHLMAKSMLTGVLAWQLMFMFFTGSRQRLGLIVLPLLGMIYFSVLGRWRRMANLAILVLLLLTYAAFQLQLLGRETGFDEFRTHRVDEALLTPAGHQMFEEVLHVTKIIPGDMNYSPPGTAIFLFFINPIPRAIWPNKPVDPLWVNYAKYRAGWNVLEDEATIAVSIVGQFYAEGGMAMVFLAGFIFGFWAFLADDLLRMYGRRPEIVCIAALLITLLLLNFRGLVPGLVYAVPALYLLLWMNAAIERLLGLPRTFSPQWYIRPAS